MDGSSDSRQASANDHDIKMFQNSSLDQIERRRKLPKYREAAELYEDLA